MIAEHNSKFQQEQVVRRTPARDTSFKIISLCVHSVFVSELKMIPRNVQHEVDVDETNAVSTRKTC